MPSYILYARKSSESEDRQVLSIDSQVRELEAFAQSQNFTVASVLAESRSAKAPGRPIFAKMLRSVSQGKADGILCWKLDRLARNPVDGAALIWAVDEGKLREIVTRDRAFQNTGNDKFWMQLEFGMAKKYVDDLSDNVKRGNRAKLEQGWLPGLPPIGYLNDAVTRKIVRDPDRFDILRKIWDAVLAGESPLEVLSTATDEWGLRTRKHRRTGGKPLGRSNFYVMLSNPFYYGLLVRNGESYPGSHPPMISQDEFDRVQELLGRPNRAPQRRHEFAFTGLIRCEECGASITAAETVNRYGYHYAYYHCTKRKAGTSCRQMPIREEKLETQIREVLSQVAIDDDYRDWALENLRIVHERESKSRQTVDRSLDETHRDVQKQIDALLQVRLRGLVTDEEYAAKKHSLVSESLRLKERLVDTDGRATRGLKLFEQAILFAHLAPKRFAEGTTAEKREILMALGSNLLLKDRTLRIQLQKPFHLIGEGRHSISWYRRRDLNPQSLTGT